MIVFRYSITVYYFLNKSYNEARKCSLSYFMSLSTTGQTVELQPNVKVRGAFNQFPDFFVQAFKIVIDS